MMAKAKTTKTKKATKKVETNKSTEIKTRQPKGFVLQIVGSNSGDVILNIFGDKIDIRAALYKSLFQSKIFREYILNAVEYYITKHKED